MTLSFRAAVLHAPRSPLMVETIVADALKPGDVLVRIKAAGLCHTDLEVIEGSLRYPMPIVLGHEAAGIAEEIGSAANGVTVGDHVILSWNPHCGHCFYCDHDLPILCETYLAQGPRAVAFDGESRVSLGDGGDLRQLMFLGAFGEYCVVPAEQAIVVPKELPFDRACLIGCGVMTGVGAALNVAAIEYGGAVMVIGCGAVGVSAVQGARLAGAGEIIAVDLDDTKLALAAKMGATSLVNAKREDATAIAKAKTGGRGVDTVLEAAGSPRAYLDGRLHLDELITRRIALDEINAGFAALKAGEAIRSVVMF
jgi:S-(hydroxymethyl)glutathione dehydrogenase/alcohol dehydrogenase